MTYARCSPSPTLASDVIDGDLDLDARLDGDGSDLLHHVGRRVQVDQPLVDPEQAGDMRMSAMFA